ncbi:MAG: MFS transporter [Rhodothermaceae bacterium]|nr:MFS transporter [Rhodothermaceae bacterium]MXZ57462.1 MFS transporter [Rhodothermaceae bacterium]MYB90446.1 MFS transporter [Rhodothermaceae bacterium]MYD68247.1 MFS transporter [Rhodothermaceae bacterium]MYG44237.1 MFS transporter [Rhodothermaceae bacterium]
MVNRNRLFYGSCLALLTTAFAFTVISGIAFSVKSEFVLTNAQLGVFTGVFFIGFTISQAIFSPLCDIIGMRWIVRGAFVTHVAGAILIMTAPSYVPAVAGSLCAGLGAGLVEAGCNPLVAALYPDNKTSKLNHFHMWFPYGNLIAAILLTLVFAQLGGGWRAQPLLILIPALGYGLMMFTAPFPQTEGVQAGVSVGQSFKALFAPIMLIMLPMMLLTASMELPPSSWVPPVLQAGGIDGLLVFGFVFGIMGTLRLLAGPVVRVLTPTGILFGGAILATLGLYLFSMAESPLMAFLTAAIWAAGIAYFWPTMLGYVSERNPKSGALGLGVMGAVGMLASFLVTPWLGSVADDRGHDTLDSPVVVKIFEDVSLQFPGVADNAGAQAGDIMAVNATVEDVLAQYESNGELPRGSTMQALRAISGSGVALEVVDRAQAELNPADNEGGRRSFRTLAPFGFILIVVFGLLLLRDLRAGGYRAEKLGRQEA